MSDTRKLTGGVGAMLLVGAVAFVGLYLMIQRASTRLRSEDRVASVSAIPQGDTPSSSSGSTQQPPSAPTGGPEHQATAQLRPGAESSQPAGAPSEGAAGGSEAVPAGGSKASATGEAPTSPEPVAANPPSVAGDAAQEIDLSLDEPTLQKFLEVRRRMFEVFGPNRRQFALLDEDLEEIQTHGKKILARAAIFLPLKHAKADGLQATGLSEKEYDRVAKVIYENWWRATASGVDIPAKLSEARKEMAEVEKRRGEPDIPHVKKHRLSAQLDMLRGEIGRLEWARSYPARQLLAKIPLSTQRVCEKHAKEIDDYAMKEMDLLTY